MRWAIWLLVWALFCALSNDARASGNFFAQQAELAGSGGSNYGYSVAVSGNTMVVGAYNAIDYGLDAANAADREILRDIIRDISNNNDNIVQGTFRGHDGVVDFFIKGDDVVVGQGGQFITLLKDGITNPAVVRALGLP